MDQAQSSLLQYGVLGIAVIAFAYAIVALFRRSDARDQRNEATIAKLNEDHAKALREVQAAAQAREDLIRREFSELMESISTSSEKTAQLTADAINKIYDRIISPRVIR